MEGSALPQTLAPDKVSDSHSSGRRQPLWQHYRSRSWSPVVWRLSVVYSKIKPEIDGQSARGLQASQIPKKVMRRICQEFTMLHSISHIHPENISSGPRSPTVGQRLRFCKES